MNIYHKDYFQEAMANGKANALRDRNRGGSSVTVYATTDAREMARGNPAIKAIERIRQERHELHMDCYAAVEFALFSHEWESLGS